MSIQESQKEDYTSDPNWIAYQTDIKANKFDKLAPGTYVGYVDGKFVKSGTLDDVLAETRKLKSRAMVQQVNNDEIIDIPSDVHVSGPREIRI